LAYQFSRFPGIFRQCKGRIGMANEFYSPGERRAAKVSELFAKIAPRYDFINDVQSFGLHRAWKRRLVRIANVRAGQHALDLCCGTGDLAFALAKKGARVTGLDFSEEMLRVAAEKSARFHAPSPDANAAARPAIEFIRGDAQQIPFPQNTFELITIGYGLRNLADLNAGIREMLRVSTPGGRLLALEFGKPDNAIWRGIYFGYLKAFLPLFGMLFCGSAAAYGYILESLKHYPAQNGVSAIISECGWQNVQVTNLMGGVMSIHCAEKSK
jgi:demethylmenaquinone methyltransferase/2-methoxy-6-polyprenyl-1,4-benzoquinol methylase